MSQGDSRLYDSQFLTGLEPRFTFCWACRAPYLTKNQADMAYPWHECAARAGLTDKNGRDDA